MESDFEQFAGAHLTGWLRTGYLLTGDQGAAEDLLQDTLVKAYRKWSQVTASTAPVAYVRRMLINIYLDQRRAHRPRLVSFDEAQARMSTSPDATAAFDDRDELRRALRALSRRERSVVVLKYYHQLNTREIAEALHLAESGVRATLSRAMKHLRGTLTNPTDVERP